MPPGGRRRGGAPDPDLQRGIRRAARVHDRQNAQERALLRQVHRLLPDTVHAESNTNKTVIVFLK